MRTYIVPEMFGVPLTSLEFALILWGLALLLSLRRPTLLHGWFSVLEHWLCAVSYKKAGCVVGVGVLALAARLAFLPVIPPGHPEMADEFAYLLAAQTFASGRATNQPHPLWVYFETVNQIQQPTYQSKYPVGQSLALAAGHLIGGHPWVGVWLSCALMCAAVCWMLQGWIPPPWALVGALIVLVRFCTGHSWSTFYWGGAVAAAAGALAAGALPRIMEQCKARHAFIMGFGLVLLANSRPWEGFVLGLGLGAVLLAWMIRNRHFSLKEKALRIAAPIAVMLALGALGMGWYFKQVTGDPFTMPYTVYAKTYDAERAFIWQEPDFSKTYRHEDLRQFHHEQARRVERRKACYLAMMITRAERIRFDCLIPGLLWALLFFPLALRERKNRLLLFLGAASLPAFMLTTYFFIHYLAPMLGLLYAVVLAGLRRLRSFRPWGLHVGLALTRVLLVVWLAALALQHGHARDFQRKLEAGEYVSFWSTRMKIQRSLAASDPKDLVIVRYGLARCQTCDEWVYNEADIDAAPVVWARDMGPADNEELIRYFDGYDVWTLDVRTDSVTLKPRGQEEPPSRGPKGEDQGLRRATSICQTRLSLSSSILASRTSTKDMSSGRVRDE